MAILQLTVAGIGETIGSAIEDYYDEISEITKTEADSKAQTQSMIVLTILIVILTTWMTYLYTLIQERKPKETKEVILKEVTEVYIQTDKRYKEPDLKDGGSQTESKRVRTVKTQSQCKYTYWNQQPRFQPLPENTHGCETDGDPYAWSYM